MELKKDIKAPEWSNYVKTGAHAMRPPEDNDWWYVRAASILRKVRTRGPIGVGNLRTWYGGRKNRGVKPEKHVDAGGKVIRTCLQQLEQAGYIKKEAVGRVVTPKGQSLLDKAAAEVAKEIPALDRQKIAPRTKPKAAKKKAAKTGAEPEAEEKPKKAAKKAAPKKRAPKAEAPAEEPKAEEPKAEEPVAVEPAAEEPKAGEPVAEEPAAEEPKAEAPVGEPKPEPAGEPVAEEPAKEAEEPKEA